MAARAGATSSKGVIDDSDVFSIIIDPERAEDRLCQRVQRNLQERERGRTVQENSGHSRHCAQDARAEAGPGNRDVVYAGTTEGLYKTLDGGKSFERMTGPDVIVNDVLSIRGTRIMCCWPPTAAAFCSARTLESAL
jgi:hypothetical protein